MRNLPIIVATVFVLSSVAAWAAPGDDASQIRQQLASLSSEIDQVDAKLTDIGKQRSDLQAMVDNFGKAVEENKSAGQQVRELDAQLATRRQQLEAEQHAATELCGRKTAEEREYKALVARCEAAGAAYRQHAGELKSEYDKVVAAHAKYEADTKRLDGEHKQLEQQRDGVAQTQSSLHAERERLVKEFNDTRDRLVALQAAKPD
jgi:septal ring factor EnvC (AmiA/AmiB activator)